MRLRAFLIFSVLVTAASLLSAHDLFIKFDGYFVSPNTSVRVPILNGTFEVSENSVTRDRVPDISVVSASGRESLDTTSWLAEGDTTFVVVETGDPGTYVLGASTNPNDLALAAEDFNTYLEHDGIPDVLEARRANEELDKDVVERYSKHVKAVFQVGEERDTPTRWWQFWRRGEPAYLTRLGYPAELVPLSNPYMLVVGDELRVLCLVDGQPVANQLVIAGGETGTGLIEERAARTDEQGIVGFTIDAVGKWYIKFINMVPSSDDELDYESKWATLTFEII